MKHSSIAVNANGGALTAINATQFARGYQIAEDNVTPQGLTIQWPDGTTNTYPPGAEPINVGNLTEGGLGALVGVPANINNGGGVATKYCSVKSATATVTNVRLTEYS